jgi:hypothetical protein
VFPLIPDEAINLTVLQSAFQVKSGLKLRQGLGAQVSTVIDLQMVVSHVLQLFFTFMQT